MFCPKCGFENGEGLYCCVRCGMQFPRFLQDSDSIKEHIPINGRLRAFENAVSNVKSGTWSLEQFRTFLFDINEVLSTKEKEIREIVIPEEASEEFQEELSVGYSGISLYNEGISYMMLYEGEGTEMNLDIGLTYVRKGNERINEAMSINRANRNKLEEEISNGNANTL